MPSEALGSSGMLAGISAGLATLQNLLQAAARPSPDRQTLIDAIELDPALLMGAVAHLRPASLAAWHEGAGAGLLQALAIQLAFEMPCDADTPALEALRQSLIASELARRSASDADEAESRLMALLAGSGISPDVLEKTGFPQSVIDAANFCREPPEKLDGTPATMRVVAAAVGLDECEESPGVDAAAALLSLRADEIAEATGRATWRFEQISRSLPGGEQNPQDLATAAAKATVWYRGFLKDRESIALDTLGEWAAKMLPGCRRAWIFRATGDALITSLDGQTAQVSVDGNSNLARVFREQTPISLTASSDCSVLERQLMTGGDALSLLPLADQGVIACQGADVAGDPLTGGILEALGAVLASSVDEDEEVIPRALLEQKVREISHEINNPLSIVQNYLRTLAVKLGDDSPLHREIDAIGRELRRVSSLLERFRYIGRSEPLVLREVHINELVDELISLTQRGHDAIDFRSRLDPEIPRLLLPADALRQVLLNLLKNATEALQNSESARIVVVTQGAVNVGGRHYLEIEVADNGPGLSARDRLALFEPGHTTKGDGRGVGLAIVQDLVDRMAGTLTCRENRYDDSGTSFQVLIPFHFAHEPEL